MINVFTVMVAMVVFFGCFMHGYEKQNRKYIIISCLLMFALYGGRNVLNLGSDAGSSYYHGFLRMSSYSLGELFDIHEENFLFDSTMKIFHTLFAGNYQCYIAVVAAFVMISFGKFIYKYSPNPLQSFCYYWGLLYYTFMFDALKQSIAMAILLFAFDAIIEKKMIKFIFLVLLAAGFHVPALCFLPAYWIVKLKNGKYYLIFLGVLLGITFIFRENILDFMTDIYDTQLSYDSGGKFLANKVIIMIVIVAAALVLRRPQQEDRIYYSILQFMGIAIVFQTFSSYNNTFERLADYYFQFSVVFIPMIFERKNDVECIFSKNFEIPAKTVAPYIFCGFGIWRFANTIYNSGIYLPFKFFWQK